MVRDNRIDNVCIHVFIIHVQKLASRPKSPGPGTIASLRDPRCTVNCDGIGTLFMVPLSNLVPS